MPTLRFSCLLVLLSLLTATVQAQKVKYKDIYVWLSNKQYVEAEPFLKKYLKETDDNPNAFLFMGLVYESKGLKNDVLQESKESAVNFDSALFYLDKAFKTINEKELKRNSEYYENFKRRDFRTGTEGIKISDVQLFIESKQQEIKERIDKAKLTKDYFTLSDNLYKKCVSLYSEIREQYKTNKSFYLQAEEPVLKQLETLSERFDSCTFTFDIYKTNMQGLGKSKYNQTIDLKAIKEIATDGIGAVDFYENNLPLWDYKIFADEALKLIKQELIPLREQLINFDINVNNLRTKLGKDSVSVRVDLAKLRSGFPYANLQKYDADPLPAKIFAAKAAELEYRSLLAEHKPFRDSANVHLKVSLAKKELAAVKEVDSVASQITPAMIDAASADYKNFITSTYNSSTVLKSFVRGLQEYSQRERMLKEFEVTFREAGTRWLQAGIDSVALFLNPGKRYNHNPLAIVNEKFTSGIVYKDTVALNGYFYSITPSRKPDISITFPVEKATYNLSKFAKAKSFMLSDPAGQIFFVVMYSENKVKDKISATVAKIYRSDGLAWSSNFLFDAYPTSANFANGELIVALLEGQNIIIDKNGKMK